MIGKEVIRVTRDKKEELDKIYITNSKRHKKDEQVTFRLVTIKVKNKGHRKKDEKLLGYATNLNLSPKSIRRIML
ncbi:hypothetical protein [Saccharolobus islandicus]|uniref:hypothetical protein n=1 Tax=Saccharolobus islandicus TaxID=43080 RepID=UPI00036CFDC4|nr:hypothetical protein [Sulfolobus islandicus]